MNKKERLALKERYRRRHRNELLMAISLQRQGHDYMRSINYHLVALGGMAGDW